MPAAEPAADDDEGSEAEGFLELGSDVIKFKKLGDNTSKAKQDAIAKPLDDDVSDLEEGAHFSATDVERSARISVLSSSCS